MTTQQSIAALADFIRYQVVAELEFQQAYALDFAEHDDFARSRITPQVYEAVMPKDAAEARPEFPHPSHVLAPCVIVRPSGTANFNMREGLVSQPVTLFCQVWDPGRFIDGQFVPGDAGYRDIATLVDRLTTALAQAVLPGGVYIEGNIDFTYGDFGSPENWPYYPAEVNLSMQYHRYLLPTLEPDITNHG